MLSQLSIRNVLLIDQLDLDVPSGLTVLTGETGAGKSILLDSIGLALGERSEASLVRQGAEQASVSLTFALPKNHAAHDVLQELGLRDAPSNDPLILRRVVSRDGRSRAFADDQPVAINALKRLGGLLVEIHGQYETHGLLNRENHLSYLDNYAGLDGDAKTLTALHATWQDAAHALHVAESEAASLSRQMDDLQHSIADLNKLAPQAGEAEALAEKRTRLQRAEKTMQALSAAYDELQGDKGAGKAASSARRILARAAEKNGEFLNEVLDSLARAEDAIAESTASLDALLHSDEFDAANLDKIEERLFALRASARKYQCTPEELPGYAEKLHNQLKTVQNSDAHLKKLRDTALRLQNEFAAKAEAMHGARTNAARKLEKAIQVELPPLKLDKARITITVEKLALEAAGPRGLSRVTFTGSTNPDLPPGPLNKIASGGELARFMLALRLCLAESADTTTLIFDEVDTGIGGATADAVGERLVELGGNIQTLAITHSPQVAARGNQHWRVEKSFKAGVSSTRLVVLPQDERREEIARMLAGSAVTDAAREAAASLLDGKAPLPKKRKAS